MRFGFAAELGRHGIALTAVFKELSAKVGGVTVRGVLASVHYFAWLACARCGVWIGVCVSGAAVASCVELALPPRCPATHRSQLASGGARVRQCPWNQASRSVRPQRDSIARQGSIARQMCVRPRAQLWGGGEGGTCPGLMGFELIAARAMRRRCLHLQKKKAECRERGLKMAAQTALGDWWAKVCCCLPACCGAAVLPM